MLLTPQKYRSDTDHYHSLDMDLHRYHPRAKDLLPELGQSTQVLLRN